MSRPFNHVSASFYLENTVPDPGETCLFEELFDERHAFWRMYLIGFTAHREGSSPLVARSVTVETVPTRETAPPRTSASSRHPDMAADDWRSRPFPRAVDCVEKCWAAVSILEGVFSTDDDDTLLILSQLIES